MIPHECLQFGSSPRTMVHLYVCHRQSKPRAFIEWRDSLGFFPSNNRIDVLTIQKKQSTGEFQQLCSTRRFWIEFGFCDENLFRFFVVLLEKGCRDLAAALR